MFKNICTDKQFTSKHLLEYIEAYLKLAKQNELKTANQSNYKWLMAKDTKSMNVYEDLEDLLPLIHKMTPENCAAIVVKVDSYEGNWSSLRLITLFRNLLEEQYSLQVIAENIKRAKEGKKRTNKVRPMLVKGRVSSVMFIREV